MLLGPYKLVTLSGSDRNPESQLSGECIKMYNPIYIFIGNTIPIY